MHKNWKKTMVLLLLAALAAMSFLAGCSNNSSNGSEPNAEGSKEGTSSQQDDQTKHEISVSIYDRGNVPVEEGTIENNRWTKWLVENSGVDTTFVAIPRNNPAEKLNTLFASGAAPDLIFEFNAAIRNQLYNQKQLMPLDDLIAQHSTEYKEFLEKYPIIKKLTTKSDGKMYEFGRISGLNHNVVLMVRADWLENLNLKAPQTTEQFFEVAKAFTEDDPDRNGKDDTFGMALSFASGMVVDQMFGSYHEASSDSTWVIENGKLIRQWNRIKAAMAFEKRLYEAGTVDKDFVADKNGDKSKQDFITGKLGMIGMVGGAGAAGLQAYETLKQNDPAAKVIIIPLPESEFGSFTANVTPPVQTTGIVNARAKDPVGVMKYVDALVKTDTQHTLAYGFEGTHWNQGTNGCPAVIDEAKNKQELSWNMDFTMLSSPGLDECSSFKNKLDPNDPLEQEFIGLIEAAEEAYISPERPIPLFTHQVYFPAMPEDIELIRKSAEPNMFGNIYTKAVIGGSKYSVDQAMEDMQTAWKEAGGAKVDEWFDNWYQENKETAVLTEDIYELNEALKQ
ncbi:extracellular solute-binding protein [Paenibacillus sp. J5C_2022]|uniref:extracellular solute-binding protein n=1 Tax=Paenibacillus sp. J5C2022 TaxID=2977129 RepID=UPI0021D3A0B2|nr:extracellular solute-binding protein [Paenibacillus sp. J5C2022]MCU6712028.1 extracellular solute-binding protein [Paenibacillus sp. J5C2022]